MIYKIDNTFKDINWFRANQEAQIEILTDGFVWLLMFLFFSSPSIWRWAFVITFRLASGCHSVRPIMLCPHLLQNRWSQSSETSHIEFSWWLHLTINCTHNLFLATNSTCTRRYKDMRTGIVANVPPFGGRLPHFGPICLIAMSPSRETYISLIHKFSHKTSLIT